MRLVVATSNLGKLNEFKCLLPAGVSLVPAVEVGVALPVESGSTYLENALLKAHAVSAAGWPAIADDSGLEVDALDGAPGVRSARYAGDGATDEQNNLLLLDRMTGIPRAGRTARFRSIVVLVTPGRREFVASGIVEGRIIESPRGSNGFGYDPLFEFDDPEMEFQHGRTAAEIDCEHKNLVSHRSRAVRRLLADLLAQNIDFSRLESM